MKNIWWQNKYAKIENTKARGHDVVIGGMLYADALGQSGTYAGTYIGMMDHNTYTITNALGGTAKAFMPEHVFASLSHTE